MKNRIIKVILLAITLYAQGCMPLVAPLPDAYYTLHLTYKYNNKTYQINHNWHCTYKKAWNTSSGSFIETTASINDIAKALDETTYLYIGAGGCGTYDGMPAIVEVKNLSKDPKIKLVNSGFYEACSSGNNASNVIDWKISETTTPQEDSVLSESEINAATQISKLDYVALPIYVFTEQQWKQYPELATNLATLKKITTPRDYRVKFLHDDFYNYHFPNIPRMSNNVIFATQTDKHWKIIKGLKEVSLFPNEWLPKMRVEFNSVQSEGNAFYDPKTKSIYKWELPKKCF